jgi:hypothetical protein
VKPGVGRTEKEEYIWSMKAGHLIFIDPPEDIDET